MWARAIHQNPKWGCSGYGSPATVLKAARLSQGKAMDAFALSES